MREIDDPHAAARFGGASSLTLRKILGVLRDAYCRTIGVEYMHIQDPEQRQWIQERVEVGYAKPTTEEQLRILRRLERDIHERGRDFDHVVSQYLRHVRPMHMGFVEPSKHHADIIVPHGGNNDIAIGMIVGALRARLMTSTGMR